MFSSSAYIVWCRDLIILFVLSSLLILPSPSIAQPVPIVNLNATVRDFRANHPDFQNGLGNDRGVVQNQVGPQRKPVYAPSGGSSTTHGRANFDQWYRDVSGVNQSTDIILALDDTDGDGTYTYVNNAFFPIDGRFFARDRAPACAAHADASEPEQDGDRALGGVVQRVGGRDDGDERDKPQQAMRGRRPDAARQEHRGGAGRLGALVRQVLRHRRQARHLVVGLHLRPQADP